MRVVVNWPLEFVLVTTDPVETDHENPHQPVSGEAATCHRHQGPGRAQRGIQLQRWPFRSGRVTTVVVVARVLVVRVVAGPVLVVGALVVDPVVAVVAVALDPVAVVAVAVVPVAVVPVAVVPVAVVPVRFVPVRAEVAVLVLAVPLVPWVVFVFRLVEV